MPQVRTDRLDASWVETLDRVQAFVAARVGDPDLAADITQDVVVRSIAAGALDRVDDPTAWLYRSARNAVIDHYRTRHVHDPFDGDDAWPEPGPLDNEPNDATRELARCLQPLRQTAVADERFHDPFRPAHRDGADEAAARCSRRARDPASGRRPVCRRRAPAGRGC